MKRIICHIGIVAAIGFNMWISARVLNDWLGLAGAVVGIAVFPITTIILPVVMFFVPSQAAGPLSLWPGIVAVGVLLKIRDKGK